jgi:hypothetical protein
MSFTSFNSNFDKYSAKLDYSLIFNWSAFCYPIQEGLKIGKVHFLKKVLEKYIWRDSRKSSYELSLHFASLLDILHIIDKAIVKSLKNHYSSRFESSRMNLQHSLTLQMDKQMAWTQLGQGY